MVNRVSEESVVVDCPACGGAEASAIPAVVSPWIVERVGIKNRTTTYSRCWTCGSGFFNRRYSEAQMGRLYSGYRNADYFEVRQRWEPTYTAQLNDDLGNADSVVGFRQRLVREAIRHAEVGPVRTIVDIGGDRGQNIPVEVARRFVLEVSGSRLVDGVVALGSTEEVAGVEPDLVMMCGILEHLESPLEMVAQVARAFELRGSGALYVEVPAGVPSTNRFAPGSMATLGAFASRSRTVWTTMFRATSGRTCRGLPVAPLRQSEHLNFFSTAGLSSLLQRGSFDVRLVREVDIPQVLLDDGGLGFTRIVQALAAFGGLTT